MSNDQRTGKNLFVMFQTHFQQYVGQDQINNFGDMGDDKLSHKTEMVFKTVTQDYSQIVKTM